ncbi:hypothetical protein VCUG_01330, partial [Vavraia culicis subsp. floridensis]
EAFNKLRCISRQIAISSELFDEISAYSTKYDRSVKSFCEITFPNYPYSELYKLIQRRQIFTRKEFCEALGIKVELKPADPVAGSKSQSAAEPGSEPTGSESTGKEPTGRESTGKEATIKKEAKGWFARNRV